MLPLEYKVPINEMILINLIEFSFSNKTDGNFSDSFFIKESSSQNKL